VDCGFVATDPEVRAQLVTERTNEIQRLVIARGLLGRSAKEA
jgi:alkylation response protein AidB-like acyl-CoA dehydrogenase